MFHKVVKGQYSGLVSVEDINQALPSLLQPYGPKTIANILSRWNKIYKAIYKDGHLITDKAHCCELFLIPYFYHVSEPPQMLVRIHHTSPHIGRLVEWDDADDIKRRVSRINNYSIKIDLPGQYDNYLVGYCVANGLYLINAPSVLDIILTTEDDIHCDAEIDYLVRAQAHFIRCSLSLIKLFNRSMDNGGVDFYPPDVMPYTRRVSIVNKHIVENVQIDRYVYFPVSPFSYRCTSVPFLTGLLRNFNRYSCMIDGCAISTLKRLQQGVTPDRIPRPYKWRDVPNCTYKSEDITTCAFRRYLVSLLPTEIACKYFENITCAMCLDSI